MAATSSPFLCYNQDGDVMKLHVEGALSTKAVIEAGRREVYEILINKNKRSRDINYLKYLAKKNKIPIRYVKAAEIDKYASGKSHGGILAFVGERRYQNSHDLIVKENPFIAVLEGIEDPFNFGYCLRSLYAAGCDGVIVEARNWSTVADVVTRSSAGASEYIDIVESDDIAKSLQEFKKKGFTIYGANRKEAKPLYDVTYHDKLVIAIGGEKRGLSRSVSDMCDQNIYIPYANDFRNAINGSSATAIIAFEVLRQRREKGDG